jgi:uncharacterized membrane protein
MSRSNQLAVWLMWLAVPLTALDYWRIWDQLPVRMAVHFNLNWRANGWASREAALGFAMGVVMSMLLVFTVASYGACIPPVPAFMRWVLLTFFYGVLVLVCAVNHWVVRYNLGERTTSVQCVEWRFRKLEMLN